MTTRTAGPLVAVLLLLFVSIVTSQVGVLGRPRRHTEIQREALGDGTCQETTNNACSAGDVTVQDSKLSRFSQHKHISLDTMLHVSANGSHEGWLVLAPRQEDGGILPCHIQLAKHLVAKKIVAEYDYENDAVREVDLRGPHSLVDEEGKAFPKETTSNRLHLLLPREAFIHEAVEEGHVRTLSDGTSLTTLSLNPRVFLVDPILSPQECEDIIDTSSKTLQKSPEKHYSDGYKNYRTSLTGSLPEKSPLTRKLWSRVKYITAMPDGGVEDPQLLKYDTNTSWYKEHHDFFHNFEQRPLEEVRMFVQMRAKELLRLNISPEITRALGDESSIEIFDPIHETMNDDLAKTLLNALGIASSKQVSPQKHLHHLLLILSEYPVEEFAIDSIFYAIELLRANGAPDPRALAERYFQLEGVISHVANADALVYYDLEDYVPYVVKPIQSNRHVTVLPILRSADRGGNTAFPEATSNRMGVEPDGDEEFEECKQGLVVKAQAGQALLFYNRLARGDLDYGAIHAGCPPKEGEKFAVNCFTWDTDQDFAYKFLTSIDELY